MSSDSVDVHGPSGLGAKVAVGEPDASATVTGVALVCATPACCSCTVIGVEAAPAATVAGAELKPSAGYDQVWNSFHVSTNDAPLTAAVHQPVHAASGAAAESRIAAASRSSSVALWLT